MTPDNIYANPRATIASFKFDDKVAAVFADMIARSVPGYGLTLDMIGVIASHYGKPNSHCYDLGCSLGASTLAMRHNVADNCKIIAIDNSTAMVEKCRQLVAQDNANAAIDVRCDDICNVAIDNASLVAMNFTLQFIEAGKRADLLEKIYHGLNTGGAFILSEKIIATGSGEQETLTNLHHDFKRAMGYSDLEIAQKRSAIENVLVPSTIASHKENLHAAGFSQVYLWFQCFNFVSLIAIK
ncbi:MAG: tRNA (cmo5U34)-methyltransferase [Pseudomonadales bacterium]|jgi:tRNA (cmo5U34)-methyltransferase